MNRCCLICIAVLAMVGCSDQDKRVNGRGVVDHISYSKLDGLRHINVWPVKDTPLSALADLDLFSDFRPGLTFQDVANRHGQPSGTQYLANLTELRCYRRPNATLAVGREPLGSYHPTIKEKWTVWAFPIGSSLGLDAIAKQAILNQVQLPPMPFCLVLRESISLEGGLWITVGSNGVREVRWINPESTRAANQ